MGNEIGFHWSDLVSLVNYAKYSRILFKTKVLLKKKTLILVNFTGILFLLKR